MRFVTLRAAELTVKLALCMGLLVTAAARARFLARVARGRVRVVTGDAAATWIRRGVIRMHLGVTLFARLYWVCANIVRGVTAATLGMGRNALRSERAHFGVAGATRCGRVLFELVRTMAPDAGRVPVCE